MQQERVLFFLFKQLEVVARDQRGRSYNLSVGESNAKPKLFLIPVKKK